ncbi:uncharacterized protein [Miscanthus floridulus]|uniref:uncharacterized protein n=1 Tax=Miscanthus floridulus TaxID=154761 RepID=UPI00345967CB
MRLPWPWRRKLAPQHGEVPVAVGTHLHVAAGDDDDDGAESTASSEHSHLTLPLEEELVHVDDEADSGDGVRAHYEVAGSGSEEQPPSGSESDGEPGDAGHRSRAARRHHSPRGRRRRRSARVPPFTAAAVVLLVLAALVAWKRRQRAGS